MNAYVLPSFLCSICLFLILAQTDAQYTNKPNTYYIEGAGAGGWVSLNYGRHFGQQNRYAAHVGLGYYSENRPTNRNFNYLTIPFGIKILWPIRKDSTSFLLAGLGSTFEANTNNIFKSNTASSYKNYLNFVPSFGYQRNEKNGIFWRITLSAFLGDAGNYPWLGLAIGFRK